MSKKAAVFSPSLWFALDICRAGAIAVLDRAFGWRSSREISEHLFFERPVQRQESRVATIDGDIARAQQRVAQQAAVVASLKRRRQDARRATELLRAMMADLDALRRVKSRMVKQRSPSDRAWTVFPSEAVRTPEHAPGAMG